MHAKIEKTKRSLLGAYCELLQTHTPQEVTVAQLCRKAGVNRTTFYKYYAVPNDIVAEKIDEYVREFLTSALENDNLDIYSHMLKMCDVLKESLWLLKLYTLGGKDLMTLVRKMLPFSDTHDIERDHRYIFVSGGVTAILLQWMQNDCATPPHAIARLLKDCVDLNMK